VVPPASPARRAADEAIECIGCGICYSACDVVAWDRDYLGPAALNRAWTLVSDVRDTAREERLAAVGGDSGCQCCHTHMSCTSFCPKGIAPTWSIAGLKRAVFWQALKGGRR
jgi:fumarate reductase iron-sulfur subunit